MLLAIISDQELFVVEPGGRIQLEQLDASEDVRLVPTSGGRPTGVSVPTESLVVLLRQNNGKRGLRKGRCMLR